MDNNNANHELLTKKELKEFLRVGDEILEELLKSGRITGIKLGRRKTVYAKQKVLDQLLANS